MDVMLDLETFSTAPNAAIVQIGACFFNPRSKEIGPKFYTNVNLASSLLAGLHIDPDTVVWWRGNAHEHLLQEAKSLRTSLEAFSKWFQEHGQGPDTFVWSHGASFDVPIMDSAFRALGLEVPWGYRNVRDTRTFFAVAKDFGWQPLNYGEPAHQALADAVAQATQVQDAARKIYRP